MFQFHVTAPWCFVEPIIICHCGHVMRAVSDRVYECIKSRKHLAFITESM